VVYVCMYVCMYGGLGRDEKWVLSRSHMLQLSSEWMCRNYVARRCMHGGVQMEMEMQMQMQMQVRTSTGEAGRKVRRLRLRLRLDWSSRRRNRFSGG